MASCFYLYPFDKKDTVAEKPRSNVHGVIETSHAVVGAVIVKSDVTLIALSQAEQSQEVPSTKNADPITITIVQKSQPDIF